MTDEPQPAPNPLDIIARMLACPDLNLDSLEPETIAAIEQAKAALERPATETHGVLSGIRLTRDRDGLCKVILDYGAAQVEVITDKRKIIDNYAEGWKINWLVKKALAGE